MAELNLTSRKMSNTKLKLSDLNPHLMCVLCGGYYIDATTIVECLHSFCRSCIVKHLENSKYCPICEVQVHKTKPLINIRPDKTLQNIVYKLVPGLFESEMRNRRSFYRERPHYMKPPDSESCGEVSGERKIYVNDENITFSLTYHEGGSPKTLEESCREFRPPSRGERRYFKCPTGVTVHHLQKLLRAKYELSESNYRLEIYFRGEELHQDFTLLDISYVYLWKAKGTLDLTYKIFENVIKRQKMEETCEKVTTETNDHVKVNVDESEARAKEEKREKEKEKEKEGEKEEEEEEEEEEKNKVKGEEENPKERETEESNQEVVSTSSDLPEKCIKTTKENGVGGKEEGGEGIGGGGGGGVGNEVQLQISESGVMRVSRVESSEIVRTVEETATKVTNEGDTGVSVGVREGKEETKETKETKVVKEVRDKVKEGKKSGRPHKLYKTIHCSPKAWHPVIPKEKLRPTLMKNSDEPRKPPKFFKMRNMPRFLGNPSTGVKPLFAESGEKKPEEKKPEPVKAAANNILKIDPKTLRPIDKDQINITNAPSAPNLLTNPFIPNNNHFLFSDFHLLPPNATATLAPYKDKPSPPFKPPLPNGSFPFPAPAPSPSPSPSPPAFYPFPPPLPPTKPQPFAFASKMDPLLRASRLSPFGGLAGFNVAGFHASLPPSISRLLNPHHHFRKLNQSVEKRGGKDESTKEMTKRCDDSFKLGKGESESRRGERGVEEVRGGGGGGGGGGSTEEEKNKNKDKDKNSGRTDGEKGKINGETEETDSQHKSSESNACAKEKEKEKDKDKDR